MPNPKPNEQKDEFIKRCMGDSEANQSFPEPDQRYAFCISQWEESKLNAFKRLLGSGQLISFDYDDVFSTKKGFDMAVEEKTKGNLVYLISARSNKSNMTERASKAGIPLNRVYAVGSNKKKIEKVKELGIDIHYDNNPDVISELGKHGRLFQQYAESYTDYPKQATENAKIALRWAEEHGWGSCLEATGKARANQLAKGEPISEDTISRMASFERHRQHSQKELGDGCGRLAWLAWGGDAGIEWAQRKLEQIRNERNS